MKGYQGFNELAHVFPSFLAYLRKHHNESLLLGPTLLRVSSVSGPISANITMKDPPTT